VAPTTSYAAQTILFYVIALLSAGSAVASVEMDGQWRGVIVMLLVWITSASMHLAKTMRDTRDADLWMKLEKDKRPYRTEYITNLSRGTISYQVLVWLSFIISTGVTLGWMWTWDEDVISLPGKGFFSVCFIFAVVSCFHFAKLVRDRNDPIEKLKLAKNPAFQFLTVVSFVASVGMTLVGCFMFEARNEQTMFVFAGFSYAVTSSLALAKLVRDKIESSTLIAHNRKWQEGKTVFSPPLPEGKPTIYVDAKLAMAGHSP
jgi:hypothetical protein